MTTRGKQTSALAKWDFQEYFAPHADTQVGACPACPGYVYSLQSNEPEASAVSDRQLQASKRAKVRSKLWDTAISPVKAIGMNLAMIALNKYLMGGGVGIMALGMVFFSWTIFTSSLKLLFDVQRAFARFDGTDANTLWAKCLYVLLCVAGATYQFWDLKNMGLFPVHSGDYVSYIPEKKIIETSVGFLS